MGRCGAQSSLGGLSRGHIWAVGSCMCPQHTSLSPLLEARGCGPPTPWEVPVWERAGGSGPRSAVLGAALVGAALAKDRPDSLGGTQHRLPRHLEGPGVDLLDQRGPARLGPAVCALSKAQKHFVLLS